MSAQARSPPAPSRLAAGAGAAQAAADAGTSLNEITSPRRALPSPSIRPWSRSWSSTGPELADSLAIDVGDVLRYHAGIDIGRSGGAGQPLSIFIRGTNSDQSIVMIDGVRINAGTQALAPLMNISPELFDRIDIVKGPRSAIYGTDAIGGVINLLTRTDGANGADAMLDYGRYGTGEFAVDGNYSAGGTSLQAALTGQQTSGYPTYAADTLDSGYKNLSGTAAVTTHLGGIELGARYYQATGTTDYANAVYNADFTAFQSFTPLSEHFSNSLYAVHASGDLTDFWHTRLTLSRIVDDLRQQQDDPYALGSMGDFDYTSRNTIDLQNDVKIAGARLNQTLTFGAIIYEEQTNSLIYGTGYSIDTHAQTYYVQDQIEAGKNRLLLATGVAHYPGFGDHTTWNAEYGYELTAGTLLTMSAGTAFRAPSATDRFGYGGTPNLLPETFAQLRNRHQVAHRAPTSKLTFAAFQDTIDDLIVFVPDPANTLYGGTNQNVDRARIRGLEASWALQCRSVVGARGGEPAGSGESRRQQPAAAPDQAQLHAQRLTQDRPRRARRGSAAVGSPSRRRRGQHRSGAGWRIPAGGRLRQVECDAGLVGDRAARQCAQSKLPACERLQHGRAGGFGVHALQFSLTSSLAVPRFCTAH